MYFISISIQINVGIGFKVWFKVGFKKGKYDLEMMDLTINLL